MSKRWMFAAITAVAVIGLVNIILLLRHGGPSERTPQTTSSGGSTSILAPPGVLPAAMPSTTPPTQTSSTVTTTTSPAVTPSAVVTQTSGDFVTERQTMSASGKLRFVYSRERKQKVRRISVEDALRPEKKSVLWEGKGSAWTLVSPDDQWIALDHHSGSGGSVQLYHRANESDVRFEVADKTASGSESLQNAVWHAFLAATSADAQTPQRGVTIDATDWHSDSRTLGLSVAFLRAKGEAEVADPWGCTYDVVSKQIGSVSQPESQSEEGASSETTEENAQGASQAENNESGEEEGPEDDGLFPGEKFPATRTTELTVPDVNQSSLSEITYAINEMFARHGASFRDKNIAKQFSQFSWYQPRTGLTYDQVESEFSELERNNLKVLSRCRDAKLAAAKRQRTRGRGQATRSQQEAAGEQFLRAILEGIANGLQNP